MQDESRHEAEPAGMEEQEPWRLTPLLENPIAVRECRRLRRRAGNWRIWVGVKWPMEPTVWGAPVILTYSIAPYGLWATLACLHGFHAIGDEKIPVDAFAVLTMVFWLYVAGICLVLGATAVTHEREQQTWDQLRVTALSGSERAAGFLWGRFAPVWASLLLTAGLWWLLQPNYSALLGAWFQTRSTRRVLAHSAVVTLALSILTGEIGLLVSAWLKSTAAAVTVGMLLAAPCVLAGVLILSAELAADGRWYSGSLMYAAFYLLLYELLCACIWEMLKARLRD